MEKAVMYQLMVRLFGNQKKENIPHGTIAQNGCGKFNDINDKALSEIKKMGVTHVWLTGVVEHAKTTSYANSGIDDYPPHLVKGAAGSPYAIVDYYDVEPDLAVDVPNRMDEFQALVDRCHANGLKVIIDFVPNHVARHYKSDAKPDGVEDFGKQDDASHAFLPNNNFYYLPGTRFQSPVAAAVGWENRVEEPAKVTGNDCLSASPSMNDWYETVKLNYGVDLFHGRMPAFDPVPDTWHKMVHILKYWLDKGVDGFRCDMAEMVPVSFWNFAISRVKEAAPGTLFVAEVYNPAFYHDYLVTGGFDWLYDKVGMYDALRGVVEGYRGAQDVSAAWEAVAPIHKHMLFFVENHDEQRLASSFFAENAQKGWPAFFVAATLNANPVMLYFGQEVGVDGMQQEGFSGLDGRTSIFDYWGIEQFQNWTNRGKYDGGLLTADRKALRDQYVTLLNLLNADDAFATGGVYDLLYPNRQNPFFDSATTMAYMRHSAGSVVLCVVNFSNEQRSVKVIVPQHAFEFCGLNPIGYFKAGDLLGSGNKINFPAQVAGVGGIGIKLNAHQTLVFKLK